MALDHDFYNRKTLTVAKELLGKVLVKKIGSSFLKGKIVETEAYLQNDPASHSYKGITPRSAPMFGTAGYSYIYFTYGMYHCFNVVTEKEHYGGAVLIRAIEPLNGIEIMQQNRKKEKLKDLCSGPGKLCIAFDLNKKENHIALIPQNKLYIEETAAAALRKGDIVTTTRIGIKDAAHLPYRFYIKDSPFISKK